MTKLSTLLSLAALALGSPAPQGGAASGCSPNYNGEFQISIARLSKHDEVEPRDTLTLKLQNGVLTDSQNRIGYIASNYQFQFDGPPQAGALTTSGFAVCADNSLALGGSTTFYQCLSGDFFNLYDRNWAAQCESVRILVIATGSGSGRVPRSLSSHASVPIGHVSQISDGQIQAPTGHISQISDGQIQVPTSVPRGNVSQIHDGQVQAPTGRVSQISDGQIQAPTGGPYGNVSQIHDGQIQAPTGRVPQISDSQTQVPAGHVSQISDGQVQVPRPTGVVSQIHDGQTQAPSHVTACVSKIPDGQTQAPTGLVSQIPDGQIQAPTGPVCPPGPVVSQIPDGQVEVPNGTTPQPPVVPPSSGDRVFPSMVALVISIVGAVVVL